MISIIICSRTPVLPLAIQQNIEKTIGVPYEIITIDNSHNDFSIFSAYNAGVRQSNFPYLCFMHDDITYESLDWGKSILHHFSDSNVGAIGIAGASYYPYMPCTWWGSGMTYEHLLQSSKSNKHPILKSSNPGTERKEVVVFDGVWFCIRKKCFDKICFDELTFKGFHHYDLDICMQMHEMGIKMYCVSDILIHHPSMGELSHKWIESTLKLQKKWEKKLPSKCLNLGYNELLKAEYKALNEFIWISKVNGLSTKKIYSMALRNIFLFRKGYLFYKTPGYVLKFLIQYLK